MNIKEAIIVTVIFFLLSAFGFVLTFSTFSNQPLGEIVFDTLDQERVITSELDACSDETPLLNLDNSGSPFIEKLADYQRICQSLVTSELMTFTQMPSTKDRAVELATKFAPILKEFDVYGISPLVVMEPVDGNTQLSFKSFNQGDFTPVLEEYFNTLISLGITGEMIGTWIPFPEANVPYWNHDETLPEVFGENINIFMTVLKTAFPEAQGSILLNSVTYDPEDINWENGYYTSLIPYLRTLNSTLIDSVGVQGFPWVSRADSDQPRVEIFDTQKFLGMNFAVEAAAFLRKNDIWLNTGTFSSRYTNDPNGFVAVSITQRKTILNDIIEEILQARDDNFQLRIKLNLFAEDKSDTPEATDWSYLENPQGQQLFREFSSRLDQERIPLTLYDSY